MHPMMNGEEELNAHLLRTNFKEPEVTSCTMTTATCTSRDWEAEESEERFKLIWLVDFVNEYITAPRGSWKKKLYAPKRMVKLFSHKDKMPSQKTIVEYIKAQQSEQRIDYLLDILFYMKYKDKFIFRFL